MTGLVAIAPAAPDVVVFAVCAVVVVSGGAGVVLSRNAVHAALSLVLTLFGIAVLFVEQDAQFLAAVQVIVYAGAIVVLFLFVIMFLGVDRLEDTHAEPLRGQRPVAIFLTLISLGGVLALAATANWVTGAKAVSGSTHQGGHTETYLLGQSIFTTYLWAFEITAALLVIAVVGAVVLARRPTDVHRDDAPAEPVDAPAGALAGGDAAASAGDGAGGDAAASAADGDGAGGDGAGSAGPDRVRELHPVDAQEVSS